MILELNGVSFGYEGCDTISDIGFSAGPGDLVAVLGPNGVGKTTMIKCINRIHAVRSGAVDVDGRDVLREPIREVARMVGYVPQKAHLSGTTVFDSVVIGRKPHMGMSLSEYDIRLTGRVIEMMGLSKISDKPVNEISGGEYQLVQIARAVVQRPRVILLDEPTSNLDLGNQHMVMRTISGIVKANGICAVMTCHDVNLALRYCDRFVMMKEGAIDCAGGREVVNADSIRRVYGVDVDMGTVSGFPVVVPKEV